MSFVNLTKSFKSDSLIALTSNVNHVKYSSTADPGETGMSGSLSFEHIHPRNRNNGIKNFYIYFEGKFEFSADVYDVRFDNINAALYNTQISLNSLGSIVEQPYINNIIKRNFDKDDYIEDANSHNSKYVYVKKTMDGAKAIYEYKCMCPLYHPILEDELVKVSELNIHSMINLYNIVKCTGIVPATELKVSGASYSVYYDEIQYTDINDTVDIMVPLHQYYKDGAAHATAAAATEQQINLNVRDVIGCPIRAFVVATPRISETSLKVSRHITASFDKFNWDVAGIPNQYPTTNISEIYLTSRNAGLLTEFGVYYDDSNKSLDPILAIKLIDRINAVVGTSDLFRLVANGVLKLGIDNLATNEENKLSYEVFIIYEYNKLYHADDTQQNLYNTLPSSINEMIEEDYDAFADSIDEMMGGSKIGDWFRNMKEKMKKNKTLSKILGAVANSSKFNNILSMIPGVGSVAPIIQNTANQLKDVAESAGYSTSMF